MIEQSTAGTLSFEQSLRELERAVRDLEDGQIGLEESLARYEQGVGLAKHCYAQLLKVEQRILELTGADHANQPILGLFQHETTAPLRADMSQRPRA